MNDEWDRLLVDKNSNGKRVYVGPNTYHALRIVSAFQNRPEGEVLEEFLIRGAKKAMAQWPSLQALERLPNVRGVRQNHLFNSSEEE